MLTDKEKEQMGKCLLKDVKIEDIINYFGSDEILSNMNYLDIANFCDYDILSYISDEDLAKSIKHPDILLKKIDLETIVGFLRENQFTVIDNLNEPEQSVLEKIQKICREIKPKGYIGQEEAKNLLCNYIDTWLIKSIK